MCALSYILVYSSSCSKLKQALLGLLYLESEATHAFEVLLDNILALFGCFRWVVFEKTIVSRPLCFRASTASAFEHEPHSLQELVEHTASIL